MKTSANIATNRRIAIFRHGSESAAGRLGPLGAARMLDEWIRLLKAESRRLGFEARTTRMRAARCN
jgi:hypothetical protein